MKFFCIVYKILVILTFVQGAFNFNLLQKSLNFAKHLRLCPSDIFINLHFAQEFQFNKSRSNEIAFSQNSSSSEMFSGNNKRTLPSCVLIIANKFEASTILELNHFMVQISEHFAQLSYRWKQPTIVLSISTLDIDQDFLQQIFTNATFSISSNVFAQTFSSKGSFSLWEIYNIKSVQFINKIFQMPILKDLSKLPKLLSPAGRRINFNGQIITAIIRTNQPDYMAFVGKGENITLVGGFAVHIYWCFQLMLNFRTGVVTGDGLVTLPNKTLGGKTVEKLDSGRAEISLSMSSVVPFRAEHLTFIQPTYYGIINCFFKQPAANSIRNIVTAPFAKEVWIVLIGTWIFLILIVKISSFLKRVFQPQSKILKASQFESKILQNFMKDDDFYLKEDEDSDHKFAQEIGMWAFTANCQKSCHIIPNSIPMKMMFLIGIFCAVVSYVGYSGAIVSTLTVNIVPVKQFSDLMKFKFIFTVHEWSEPFQVFVKLMIDAQKLKQKVITVSTADEISHLLDPKIPRAFLTYADLLYPTALELNYTEDFICTQLSQIPVSPVLYKSAMFFKKGSEYTEIFNHKVMILKESGINHRLVKRYETKNIFSCGGTSNTATVDPVNFHDVLTAFLVICVGLAGSLLLLIIELIFTCKVKIANPHLTKLN